MLSLTRRSEQRGRAQSGTAQHKGNVRSQWHSNINIDGYSWQALCREASGSQTMQQADPCFRVGSVVCRVFKSVPTINEFRTCRHTHAGLNLSTQHGYKPANR
jgi:hypothetical protein